MRRRSDISPVGNGRGRRFRVHQHLVIDHVQRRGSGLVVHVGDRRGSRHWISFDFPTYDTSAEHAETMERWRERCTRVTYVATPQHGVLVDEEELFWAAFGP